MNTTKYSTIVRKQLLEVSKETGQNFQRLCRYFVFERLLYRLGESKYSDQFVLKGGMIIRALSDSNVRVSKDLDFTGYGKSEIISVTDKFKQILSMKFDDGVEFDVGDLEAKVIRDKEIYDGIRLRTTAKILNIVVKLQIDIGFGDKLVFPARVLEYPSLLSFPRPVIRAYSIESVISEKFHAIVSIGRYNSRMKDFYDIWIALKSGDVNSDFLASSIFTTFTHRNTPIPTEVPVGLSKEFLEDDITNERWQKFLERSTISLRIDMASVIQDITMDLMHHSSLAIKLGEK